MAKVHIKRDDMVYILNGKDKAKTGKVLAVNSSKDRVIVEGVNMILKHRKPSARNQQGGIDQIEGSINASNVMLICDKCKVPTKVSRVINAAGIKNRVCKACGEEIDYGNDRPNI